jgi:hypothetical protein
MSSYNPPIEDITEFNTSLFNQPEETLSQAEADRLYLSKTKSDISTAGSTTFNGDVNVGGMLDLTSGANTSEIFQSTSILFGYNLPLVIANKNPSGHTLFINQNNTGVELPILTLNNTGTTRGVIVNSDVSLFTRTIKSTNTNSGLHTLFDNMIGSGVLTIGGTASTNSIRGNTTFPQNVTIGTDGVANNLSLKGELRLYDTASPYETYAKISTTGSITTYESPTGATPSTGTTHIFKCYNTAGVLTNSLFDITPTTVISRTALTLTNRLNFSTASPYVFANFTNTQLGYYLKETGSSFSYTTSAIPKTILTTSSIPIGVWRIDFSVQLVVGATGAGTITQSQSYISPTLDGNIGTAVPFTGSILRSHVSEVYANNDIQVITSNITYQQSTAGVLHLNIVRSFATGTYSFIGEVAITKIA